MMKSMVTLIFLGAALFSGCDALEDPSSEIAGLETKTPSTGGSSETTEPPTYGTYHCYVPITTTVGDTEVDGSTCVDYQIVCSVGSQVKSTCLEVEGAWTNGALCTIRPKTKGCHNVTSTIGEYTSWYAGSMFTEEYWASPYYGDNSITNEEFAESRCRGTWFSKA